MLIWDVDVAEFFAPSYPVVLNEILHYFDIKSLFYEPQMNLILFYFLASELALVFDFTKTRVNNTRAA